MKFSALMLAALASTSTARDGGPQIKTVCETSAGSPMLHHANMLIGKMNHAEVNE